MAILLLLATTCFADLTMESMAKQKKAASEAAAAAEGELPPCEGHDHLDDIVSRFAPPATCPKAREYFEYHLQFSRRIRDNCRETSRWMEDQLRQPDFCASDAGRQAAHEKLNAFKREINSEEETDKADKLLENETGLEFYLEDTDRPRPKTGEWSRLECGQGVLLAMQFRTRQRGLANRHFGLADYALDAVCIDGPDGADNYLDFLRKGEDGL